jgi:glycosyltransferase 2 family protein
LRGRAGAWARLLAAALIFAVLIWRVGTRPFLDGLRGIGPGTLLAALAITGVTSVCSAWRWRVVAEALGVGLPLPAATVAYYRSQFLNCTLPGGLLGDIHRGVRHGADAGSLGRGVRAVVWERTAGQVVQAAIALVVLLALPSPVHAAAPVAVAATAFAAVVVLILSRGLARHGPGRLARRVEAIVAEVRGALLQPPVWPAVMLASLLVLGGHIGMFLLAARAAGVRSTPTEMLPLALIVLVGAAIPVNVGGWGPREGVAAWVFAAAGFGAARGTAAATAFGVMTLVATLPGAAVLLTGWLRPRRTSSVVTTQAPKATAEHR